MRNYDFDSVFFIPLLLNQMSGERRNSEKSFLIPNSAFRIPHFFIYQFITSGDIV